MDRPSRRVRWFDRIGLEDVLLVGDENMSLEALYRPLGTAGVRVPNSFPVPGAGRANSLSMAGP